MKNYFKNKEGGGEEEEIGEEEKNETGIKQDEARDTEFVTRT